MLDINLLRNDINFVAERLATRGFKFDLQAYQELDSRRKHLQIETQELQNERNQRSKEIGLLKSQGSDISDLAQKVNRISEKLYTHKKQLDEVLEKLEEIHLSLPNLPHDSVPVGLDEQENVEIKRVGELPVFNFAPKSHDMLGEDLKLMDFPLAAKITGSRFVVLKAELAKLHRALIQFMLDIHTNEHSYQEIYVPYIVNIDSLIGTGQWPKFAQDLFKIEGDLNYYLTSTAEIPVTNTVRGEILKEKDLPLKYVCHTPCFRSEAGSYGKDTKGMIRQHQFEKVELVWITTQERSYDALETLTQHAEEILKRLCLPYRIISLCTGDLGATAAKTYDLEVWLPSQNTYREISSCSNTESYQARRMQARYRNEGNKGPNLVHTLNGSGLAVGRTLVAILENYQQENGEIAIPTALQPYMDATKILIN